jgi:hypothetical protein
VVKQQLVAEQVPLGRQGDGYLGIKAGFDDVSHDLRSWTDGAENPDCHCRKLGAYDSLSSLGLDYYRVACKSVV